MYDQLQYAFETDIATGRLKPGDYENYTRITDAPAGEILSLVGYAREHGLDRRTVKRSLQRLAAHGYITFEPVSSTGANGKKNTIGYRVAKIAKGE